MSVVTLRSDPAVVRGQSQARPEMKAFSVDGSAHIRFSADKTGRTRLTDLYQSNPLRVLFPYTEAGEPETAVIVTTSGGLVGGDRLSLSLELEPNAAASVIGQASEKIYRSVKDESRLNVDLYVDNGAQFEYLPQDTIVFDGSRFSRHTNLHIATDTRLLAGEMLVLGRLAHNETFRSGRLEEVWRVHVDGKLVWYDRFVLGDDMASIIEHPFGLDGANAVAAIVCHGPNLEDLQNRAQALSCVEDNLGPDGKTSVRIGLTITNNLLLIRLLARDPALLRQHFADLWMQLRHALMGRPARMPRLWDI